MSFPLFSQHHWLQNPKMDCIFKCWKCQMTNEQFIIYSQVNNTHTQCITNANTIVIKCKCKCFICIDNGKIEATSSYKSFEFADKHIWKLVGKTTPLIETIIIFSIIDLFCSVFFSSFRVHLVATMDFLWHVMLWVFLKNSIYGKFDSILKRNS